MIKKVLFSLIAGIMAFGASAQGFGETSSAVSVGGDDVLKPYVISIGPKLGLNLSMASDPEDLELGIGGNIGFSAGLAANIRFGRPVGRPLGTERFGVQVEALYAMHSLKTDDESINMNCFEIPVLFQWYMIPSLCLEVGPTFTGAFSTSPESIKYGTDLYMTKDIKAMDVMLSIGLGYKHNSGFNANLRYNMGNSDIAGNFETKVSTISLGLAWMFNVAK